MRGCLKAWNKSQQGGLANLFLIRVVGANQKLPSQGLRGLSVELFGHTA